MAANGTGVNEVFDILLTKINRAVEAGTMEELTNMTTCVPTRIPWWKF